MIKLIDLIKGRKAEFVRYSDGNLFYNIVYCIDHRYKPFIFPVPVDELDGATINNIEKASVFMKWIKKTHKEIENERR